MKISFKMGLRTQEIALLQIQIKEIAQLNSAGTEFKLLEVMSLPAAYTKGADAMGRSKSLYQKNSVSFDVRFFDHLVYPVEKLAKASAEINPEDFYPPVNAHKGKSRDLPMVDDDLKQTFQKYLEHRIDKVIKLKPTDSLFVTQKGGPYFPKYVTGIHGSDDS